MRLRPTLTLILALLSASACVFGGPKSGDGGTHREVPEGGAADDGPSSGPDGGGSQPIEDGGSPPDGGQDGELDGGPDGGGDRDAGLQGGDRDGGPDGGARDGGAPDGGAPDGGTAADGGHPDGGISAVCGNGAREGSEVCDGNDLGGASCTSLGFTSGRLACARDCRSLDTTACVAQCTPDCTGRVCGLDPICGTSCGTCVSGTCGPTGQCALQENDSCVSGGSVLPCATGLSCVTAQDATGQTVLGICKKVCTSDFDCGARRCALGFLSNGNGICGSPLGWQATGCQEWWEGNAFCHDATLPQTETDAILVCLGGTCGRVCQYEGNPGSELTCPSGSSCGTELRSYPGLSVAVATCGP